MLRQFSLGVWIVVFLAIASTITIAFLPVTPQPGMTFWIFDANHAKIAGFIAHEWNQDPAHVPVQPILLTGAAIQTRMLNGFYSDTPVADLIEVERSTIGRVFAGPVEDVGFLDLTDRLEREGLKEMINAPSFSPWMSRGRIFGLPHDVHPVMLMYRSDLVEAAGIDVSGIETWDDYFRVLRPLMVDLDGDGRVDRYLLNISPTSVNYHELMLLQAGGNLFDANEQPALNSRINTRTICRLATWYAGPGRTTAEVTTGGASAMRLLLDGYVVGMFAPDWSIGGTKVALPQMAGKFKLMPLPAWEKGGRRTSVIGGTMLGITRASRHREAAWAFAKALYLSPATAQRLFETTGIVTPIKANWSSSFYDEPDPYFGNQPIGRMFLQLAPSVPPRPSSPFYTQAQQLLNLAVIQLCRYVDEHAISDPHLLETEAQRLLDESQARLTQLIHRNVFLRPKDP